MQKKFTRTGPRGLGVDAMLEAALALMEEVGADKFSVRKVAARVGCDPMAILYHFKSKRDLERAMAEALNARVRAPATGLSWRECLVDLSHQYRDLALDYPNTMPLLMRFTATGSADYRNIELVFEALATAGVARERIRDLGFGLYASVLGLAMAEVSGLIRSPSQDILNEIDALSEDMYPRVKALLGREATKAPNSAFDTTLDMLLDGIEGIIGPTSG
ncbi:TetR/AcrR family transcriptional regulator [uncultured Roseobacter sp.]|uniref:TetR/AcrR family transcriptional regulator n=1 Tax=uncultured Roseobacter sp. TaxID=114847 RepID=UPI002608ABA7|nr:TetR/AcrR family transcriptional regulator [uncultured Roseobacter sp.]